ESTTTTQVNLTVVDGQGEPLAVPVEVVIRDYQTAEEVSRFEVTNAQLLIDLEPGIYGIRAQDVAQQRNVTIKVLEVTAEGFSLSSQNGVQTSFDEAGQIEVLASGELPYQSVDQ